jgi:hypothetical protein
MEEQPVIHEPSAAERAAKKDVVVTTPAELGMEPREMKTGYLLAVAVHRLGGVLVLSEEECQIGYTLAEDFAYNAQTGGIRLWSIQQET